MALVRRYHAAALPLFEAICAAPDCAGIDTFDVSFDAREIARKRGMGEWARRDDDEIRRLVTQFKPDLGSLPGAPGAAIARLLARALPSRLS